MLDQMQMSNRNESAPSPTPGLAKTSGTNQLALRAILERGWTRTMVEALLGEPDDWRDNPKYRSAAPMRLYLHRRVLEAEATPEFAKRLEKVSARRRGKDYTPALVKMYGAPGAGVHNAAEALFSLNRYAKHGSCTRKHKTETTT